MVLDHMKKGYKGKKTNTPPKYKRGKSVFMSPKDKHKRVILPSTLEYKDTTKKFSNVHTYESFIVTMYNSLCQESNSIADVLINDH